VVFGARVAHFDEVIESAEWLLERYPDERDLLLDLARAGLQSGRVDVTRGALRRLRDMDPDSAQVEALWARLFFELGDFEAAETHAWRSATLVPEQTTAHHIIGLAAENRGDLIAAIEAYRKVIFVDPGHLGARDHLATCLLRDGRRKESNRHREIHTALIRAMPPGFRHFPATERIATLGELVELLPEWDVGHLELGRALMQDGRLVEARAAVERALAARQSPESHELMATILRRLGEHELARRHGEKAGVPWEDGAE
jgi:tetratricopeptide (TPR) repeat protein